MPLDKSHYGDVFLMSASKPRATYTVRGQANGVLVLMKRGTLSAYYPEQPSSDPAALEQEPSPGFQGVPSP